MIEDGIEVNIGFTSAKAFFTPGHSESCISYIVNDYCFQEILIFLALKLLLIFLVLISQRQHQVRN